MTPDVVERLRPQPARPDPAWAAATLAAILDPRPAGEPLTVAPPVRPSRTGARVVAGVVVAALAAALALVAGPLLGPRSLPAGPVAPPSTSSSGPDAPATLTDLGRLGTAETAALRRSCGDPGGPATRVTAVHYARAVSDGGGAALRHVAVVSDADGAYRLCVSPPRGAGSYVSGFGPGVLGPGGDLDPTADRPLRLIAGYQDGYVRRWDTVDDVHVAVAYATAPRVARVEARLEHGTDPGQWFEGTTQGGFAFVPVLLPRIDAPGGTDPVPQLVLVTRAFDAQGRQVGADRQEDFDHCAGCAPFWR